MKLSLRALRINANLSTRETADKLGISIDTWRNYECGKQYPRVNVALQAAELFGCSLDSIDFLLPSRSA